MNSTNKEEDFFDAVEIPIDGFLDLHMFAPKDATSVVDEYITECLEAGIYEVKIVHGKGKGILRRTVHSFLKRHPKVMSYSLDGGSSSWGATIAHLKDD